ncbi:MAG: Ig-like domain-containing protein, partial [Gemmatimonadota bacterium]
MGQSGEVEGGQQLSFTRVWVNDGQGSFDATRDDGLVGLNNGEAAWADVDGDGDLDLAVTGKSSEGVRDFRLYRNDLPGLLADTNADLPGMESSDLAWADYDRDGDPDLVAGGLGADGRVATTLFVNDGGHLVAAPGVHLPGIQGGDLAWADLDNDQDVDLIIVGNDGQAPIFAVYENTIGQVAPDSAFEALAAEALTPVDFSAAAAADLDGDGDLDLITSGRDAGLAPRSAVNENLAAQQFNPNFRPSAPSALAAADSADAALLSWDRGADDGAPPAESLTYDLRVGTTPGGSDIVTGTGALGFGRLGSATSHRLSGLASGTYYWAVRTVDAGLSGSDWSAPGSFIVDTVPPELRRLTLGRSAAGIGQAVPVALEFADAHAGVDPQVPPAVRAVVGDSTYDFTPLQFTGTSWTGELAIAEGMPSGPARIAVSGLRDGKGNVMAPFDTAAAFTVDAVRPSVVSQSPASGATAVSAALTEVTVTFSEPVRRELAEAAAQYRLDPDVAGGDPSYDAATRTVSLRVQDLVPGTEYSVEVSAAIEDLLGNRPANSTSWSFRTAVPGLIATDPPDGDDQVATGGTSLFATFDSGIASAALRDAGAIRVLREGAPVELAGAPLFDGASSTLTFDLAEALRAGSGYQVILSGLLGGPLRATGQGDFGWTFSTAIPQLVSVVPDSGAADVDAQLGEAAATFSFALDAEEVSARNFAVLQDGRAVALRDGDPVGRGAGVYAVAPAAGWAAGSSYTVQIGAAVTGPRGSDQPLSWPFQTAVPGLTATMPGDGSADVPAGATRLTATFDRGVNRAVLALPEAIQVRREGAPVSLAATPTFDADANVLSLDLAEPLAVGSRYQVALSGRLGGLLRTTSTGDYTWSFSTAVPQLAAVTPDSGQADVATDLAEALAAFSSPLDPAVLATSFTILREGQSVALRSGDPVSRGGGVYGLAPQEGWRAGSAYTVQVSPAVAGPLGPPRPFSWQFQTAVPAVASTSPADGAAVQAGPRRVTVTFTSAVDASRIGPADFRLARGGAPVTLEAAEFRYDAAAHTVSLPSVDLASGAEYTVTVSSRMGGPRADWTDQTFTFRTAIPGVAATSPSDGAQGVPTAHATISVAFDGPVAGAREPLFQLQARSLDAVLAQGEEAPYEVVPLSGFGANSEATAVSFAPAGGLQPFA